MSTSSRASGGAAFSSAGGSGADAVSLLSMDHDEVAGLFEEYEELVNDDAGDDEKQALAERICALLTVHATVEEEIFYPAARAAIDEDPRVLDEAEVEHSVAKDLIEQIQSMDPNDELYDARVKVLGEYVYHHVQEEEIELFPQCQAADMDLEELGEEISTRKAELLEELGMEGDD